MKFTPKTDEDIKKAEDERMEQFLWKDGEYDIEVIYDMEKTSSKGNDMIELKVIAYNGDKTQNIFDYLMESMAFKMKHAFQAFGMEDRYNAGTYENGDFTSKTCKVFIATQKASGSYPAKNVIRDYIVGMPVSKSFNPAGITQPSNDILDDSIPF